MSLNQSELSFEMAMQRLATQLQPEQIILFGSRARGDARADSDYDVLIVANGEPHELARQASRLLRGRRFALDLLALSREHIEQRLENSTLLKTIMREGKVLYEPETREWLTRATEDLEALRELKPERTPSVIASLAHQAIEKTLKAIWIELGRTPPMIHDLELLWSEIEGVVGDSAKTDDFADVLFEINDYGVQARYPELSVPPRYAKDAVGLALRVCGYLKNWLENHSGLEPSN